MVESARNHPQGLLRTPHVGRGRWPSAGPAYFFLPAPCFCESAEPATLLTDLELFGLLSTFAAFDATGFDVVFPCAMLFILLPFRGVSTPLRQSILKPSTSRAKSLLVVVGTPATCSVIRR